MKDRDRETESQAMAFNTLYYESDFYPDGDHMMASPWPLCLGRRGESIDYGEALASSLIILFPMSTQNTTLTSKKIR